MTWTVLDGSGPPDFHGAITVATPSYANKLIMPNISIAIDRHWPGWFWEPYKAFTIFPKRELRCRCLNRKYAPIFAWKPRPSKSDGGNMDAVAWLDDQAKRLNAFADGKLRQAEEKLAQAEQYYKTLPFN